MCHALEWASQEVILTLANAREDFTNLYLSAFELRNLTDWPDAVIDDYISILKSLNDLANRVEEQITTGTMIVGTGTPESSVTSNSSRQYYDTAGAVGLRFYVNSTVGVDTGWVAIN